MRRYLPLVVVMFLWGSAFAASKGAVAEVPHQVAAFLRYGGGAVVLVAVWRLRPSREEPLVWRDRAAIAVLGMLGVFGYSLLLFWGLAWAPSVDGSVVLPVLSPVITTVVTVLAARERFAPARALGLLLALAGAGTFLAGAAAGAATSHRLLGDLAFVAAAGCWSAYTVRGRAVLTRIAPLRVTTWAMVAGAIPLGLVAAPALPQVPWSTLPAGFWLDQAYLALLPTALALPVYYAAVRRVGPARTTTMMFIVPVAGAACSFLLLGESVSVLQAVGSVAMLAGAWLTLRTGTSRPAVPAAATARLP